MDNYFNYFTQIEEHFQRRRGTVLLLSTLDWALIETWKDAGVPLEAVIRGIDETFDKYDRRPSKTRKINGLAYCSQEVLAAAEEMKEAGSGAAAADQVAAASEKPTGLDNQRVADYLTANARQLQAAKLPPGVAEIAEAGARALTELAETLLKSPGPRLEDLERRLTVTEEKLTAALLATTPDDVLIALRSEADRELAPYRRKMTAPQIEQLQRQYLHKRLFERYALPRLSLFYM